MVSPIPEPTLDPRNERDLVERAIQRVRETTLNRISTDEHSHVAGILEGHAYAGAELLWYLNKLPRAVAVSFMKIGGIERRLGTKAQTLLRFTLSDVRLTSFTIPQGFEVFQQRSFTDNTTSPVTFRTIEPLTIPPGAITGEVLSECIVEGEIGNVAPNTLTRYTTPLSFLSKVSNPFEVSLAGEDIESFDEIESRILAALRHRDVLISMYDYELAASELLGKGSKAVVVPLLSADKSARQLGTVHVFGVFADSSLPDAAQSANLGDKLIQRAPLGTTVYFSPMELAPLDLAVVANLRDGINPYDVYNKVFEAILGYASPSTFPATIDDAVRLNELEFRIHEATSKDVYVHSILINGLGSSFRIDNPWIVPKVNSIYLDLVDSIGEYHRFGYGEGDAN